MSPRKTSKFLFLLAAAVAVPATGVSAQQANGELLTTVYGNRLPDLAGLAAGPEIDGFISSRSDDAIQVTTPGGQRTTISISEDTRIKSSGGFLGLERTVLTSDSLMNGLPVSVQTLRWEGGLIAGRIDLKNKDLRTASMIHNGTDQRFTRNEAATEALRGRMGDIDQYNVKATTNVNFDTGRANLSAEAKNELCATAATAQQMDNALLLVVGYTDSTGTPEINQALSEKRAGAVVNYLQQACGWKPYRMLTPAGMAEADPLAANDTEQGKAMNRRVAVNVLVSRAVDGYE